VTTPPLFPLPEPPAADVAEVLDQLRAYRREYTDARRMERMLTDHPLDTEPRASIERDVVTYRAMLWRREVENAEKRARALGLDVTSQL
jgi:hypothetical protein